MMFLLRSAFWLSIVYAHMPLDDGEVKRALDETRGAAVAGVAGAAAAKCAEDRAACRALVGAATAIVFDPGAARFGAPSRAAGKAKADRPSANSLSSDDLAPPWRGPRPKPGA